MSKRAARSNQDRLASLLKLARRNAGLRQIDVAQQLQQPQSFVSKYESGERALTLTELKTICDALGLSLVEMARQFEKEI